MSTNSVRVGSSVRSRLVLPTSVGPTIKAVTPRGSASRSSAPMIFIAPSANGVERGAKRSRGAAIGIAQQRVAQRVERAAKLQRQAGDNAHTDACVEVAACFMIRDKNLADAAVREGRISGDEPDSVVFEVEACCRASVWQPLAGVYVVGDLIDGHNGELKRHD